jgi:hypothetical protein
MNYDVNVNEPVWSSKTRSAEVIAHPKTCRYRTKNKATQGLTVHKCIRRYCKAAIELEYLGFVFYNNLILSSS